MRGARRGGWLAAPAMAAAILLLCSFELVSCFTVGAWTNSPKRNVQALARDGLLRINPTNYDPKRSISTLAKNGQLPTFRSPEDNPDIEETTEQDEEKRNLAALARLNSYTGKRNIGNLVRNGVRAGKRYYDDYKRNIGALARNGYLKTNQDSTYQKRENSVEGEYYLPFYQNQIPPISEIDVPLDYNELYDIEQSYHPDQLPPLSELYDNKRNVAVLLRQDAYNTMRNSPHYRPLPTPNGNEDEYDQADKRSSIGMPNHGLYRTINPSSVRSKRYILAIPDNYYDEAHWQVPEYSYALQEKKSVDTENEPYDNIEKRHIGALARLGWLPSFRYSGSRYSRSGRARFFVPTYTDIYRKYSDDEDSGIGEYFNDAEAAPKASADDADLPPPAVPADPNPSGTGERPLSRPEPPAPPHHRLYIDAIHRNRWEPTSPQYYSFRSLKIPKNYQRSVSTKRYLLLPALDNLMRKSHQNKNLPSRRKNQ